MHAISPKSAGRSINSGVDDSAFTELILGAALELLAEIGVTKDQIIESLAPADPNRQSASHRATTKSRALIQSLYDIGKLVRHWSISEKYQDNLGHPIPLSRDGHLSLMSIASDSGIRNPEDVIQLAIDLRYIERKRNKFVQTSRTVSAPNDRRVQNWLGAIVAHHALKALTHNSKARPDDASQLFQRCAMQARLSKRHAPLFKRFAEEQGQNLLETLDDWMEQHRAPAKDKDAVSVWIHAFTWIEDDAPGELGPRIDQHKRSQRAKV